ncbi:unnamed protein product [Arctia plantaginis]|uniref:Uncharacterized protein n=1 Tax=Arctia plantaginis TaxID=874455 RepID=A0A8S1B1M3_ARCPL|nr:unnamed protein product [Arctia plantaginis]CAB3253255.1 unnamed protein product [Arctia plantaginis]
MEGIPPDGASSSSSAVRAPPLRDEEIARILNHGSEEDADSDDEDEDLVQPSANANKSVPGVCTRAKRIPARQPRTTWLGKHKCTEY